MSLAIITGSTGLVGSEAVNFLHDKGFEIIGIDNNLRKLFFGKNGSTSWVKSKLLKRNKKFKNYNVDIRNLNSLHNIFKKYQKKISIIVHCAAQPSHDYGKNFPFLDFNVNATGTLNLLELTKKYSQTLSEAADGKFFLLDKPTTGAEDFSFFSQKIPGMYFWLGVNEPGIDVAPGNHTPFFKVDDRALDEGVKAMIYLALDYASNN